MHEMSIAANIIKIAEESLVKNHGKAIDKIQLEVGQLSGIVIESLQFALDVSKKDGILKKAQIIINEIPGKLKCLNCGQNFESDDYFSCCPNCNTHELEVLAGKDIFVKSITIR